MGGHLLYLYTCSRASRNKRLMAYLPNPIRRYSQESSVHGVEERAPSTAEEFKRVAEEKAHQGFAGHTVEKAQESAEEATMGDSNSKVDSVKEKYKEPGGKGNFHKTGCD